MKTIDNQYVRLGDDLKHELRRGSVLHVAAASFSLYAFDALRRELQSIKGMEFVFTSPAFVTEKIRQEQREFYIPNIFTERELCGGEFELRLKNELKQRAIARECAEWIRQKAVFKTNTDARIPIAGQIVTDEAAYLPVNSFTTADLGYCARPGFTMPITKLEGKESRAYLEAFERMWNDEGRLQDVTDRICRYFEQAYQENSPEYIYYITLYHIFASFLHDLHENGQGEERLGFAQSEVYRKLFNFQRDAVHGAIHKLEQYGGCVLADSVGLGKTFTALAIIKYYNLRNKDVLVLCPRKLAENWNVYRQNYRNNILAKDRLRYDVLFHTDLSRKAGQSNGYDLNLFNWGAYDLVVIDESHNFRNANATNEESRYQQLMRKVMQEGKQTRVLMLSATPVNNRFNDLRNQLALAYGDDSTELDSKLKTRKGIDLIFREAQKAFNTWSKLPNGERTSERLQALLDYDFFEVLDSLSIARSRKHIMAYYDTTDIGTFPKRNEPISRRPALTNDNCVNYADIAEKLALLTLAVYSPLAYLKKSKEHEYLERYGKKKGSVSNLTQLDREKGVRKLMGINLLKRIESSVASFEITLRKVYDFVSETLDKLRRGGYDMQEFAPQIMEDDGLDFETESEEALVGSKMPVRISDMDTVRWSEDLTDDLELLKNLLADVEKIKSQDNLKLAELKHLIAEKIAHPLNEENRKVLVFTAFSDTANYLYDELSAWMLDKYGLHTGLVTGNHCRCTSSVIKAELNEMLTCFSPLSKCRRTVYPYIKEDIELLIATDCISEGQNLQDCDYLVNYDIHWNPVRLVQRFGRIDRIGSRNSNITMVNFWPDVELDTYIKLKQRVEDRMTISVMTGAGDDNLLNAEQRDMEYRKVQLQRLQHEVIDLEDVREGISITDLGLNDFRIDLQNFFNSYGKLEQIPMGLYGVVPSTDMLDPGVIFVLKNIHNETNIDRQNRMHPYYLVYMRRDGTVVLSHLQTKKLLDVMRMACKGNTAPFMVLCDAVNAETREGRDMQAYSALLQKCVGAILNKQEEAGIRSLFSTGGTSMGAISKGMEDFSLITFLIIK